MEQRSHAASGRYDHLRDAPTASLQVVRGPVSQSPPVSVESRRAGSMVAPAGLAELTTTAVVARRSTRRRAACPRLPLEHLPQGDPGANGQQAAASTSIARMSTSIFPDDLKVHLQFFATRLTEWTKDVHVVRPPYRALKILFGAFERLNNLRH